MNIFLAPSAQCIEVKLTVASLIPRNVSTSLLQPAVRRSTLQGLYGLMAISWEHFARLIKAANVPATVSTAYGALHLVLLRELNLSYQCISASKSNQGNIKRDEKYIPSLLILNRSG